MKKSKKSKLQLKKDAIINKVSFPSGLSFILDDDELLQIEQSATGHVYGIAVDLGTTSVCVSICDLVTAQEVAEATYDNQQDKYAPNLLTRKNFVTSSEKLQNILSESVLENINKALAECIKKSGVDRQHIYTAVLVGSPIMQQILLRIPDQASAKLTAGISQVKASVAGININPLANVKFLPGFNDDIGSDVLAAIASLNMLKTSKFSLCLDLGMRAKIILGNKDGVFVGTTTISSVFEGHHIKSGMVTQAGAIKWARIKKDKRVDFLTIGHIRPQGICGCGLIDVVCELLRCDILKPNGQLLDNSFLIYQDKKDKIEITQADINKIQQSKAAVSAAIEVLMHKKKIKAAKISKVFCAGQLGDYLNAEHLVKIGLFPGEFKNKIDYVGNAAFLGAKMALFSKKNMQAIADLSGKIKHIALETDSMFNRKFVKALPFSK
jgi:uncharacterized 2Fe-2S/4Fe-4S cluster protein (DUF4445 family)